LYHSAFFSAIPFCKLLPLVPKAVLLQHSLALLSAAGIVKFDILQGVNIRHDIPLPPRLVNGDEVVCFNNLGEVGFIAEVTDTVAQNTVIAEGVYNRDFAINGKLVNALHDDRLSDIGEATTLNSNTVEIKRV